MVVKANWNSAVDVLCSNIDHLIKSIVAEALALRIAMVLCLELGLWSVVLEGDSQMVVKATSNEEMLTDYGTWLSVNFTYRETNNIAHKLARLALTFSEEVWIEDGPIQILTSVSSEIYCNDWMCCVGEWFMERGMSCATSTTRLLIHNNKFYLFIYIIRHTLNFSVP